MPQHSCLQCRLRSITSSKKIPRYSAKLGRQMADRFIALYGFHGVLVHGAVKLSFSNKFYSNWWLPYALINMISIHSWCEREGDGGLLRDSAQAFSNVFFFSANQRRVHSWATYLCCCNYATFDFVNFIVNTSEQTNNFFSMARVLFGLLIFFAKLCLKVGGAAYTQVRLIHESLWYFVLRFSFKLKKKTTENPCSKDIQK